MVDITAADLDVIFVEDGGLRDIYVLDTGIAEWERFLLFARSRGAACRYEREGVPAPLPACAADVFAHQDTGNLLKLYLGPVALHCHFFWEKDIELDMDPREVVSPKDRESVLRFLAELAAWMGREVILTPEGGEHWPLLRCAPDGKLQVCGTTNPHWHSFVRTLRRGSDSTR